MESEIEAGIKSLIPEIEKLSNKPNVTLGDLGSLGNRFPRKNVFSVNIYMKSNDESLKNIHFFQSIFPWESDIPLWKLHYSPYDLELYNAKTYDLYTPQIKEGNFNTKILKRYKNNENIKKTIEGFFKGKPSENGLEIKAIHITVIHRYGKITKEKVNFKTVTLEANMNKVINVMGVFYRKPVSDILEEKEQIMLKIEGQKYVPIHIYYDPSAYPNTDELEDNLKKRIAAIVNFADEHGNRNLMEKELISLFPDALLTFYIKMYNHGYVYYNINANDYTYTGDTFHYANIWNWYIKFCTREHDISYIKKPDEFSNNHFNSPITELHIVMINPEEKDNEDENKDENEGGKINQMKNTKTKGGPIKIPQPNQKTPIKTPNEKPVTTTNTSCCNSCKC